jgi:hypothetical protein
MMSEPFNTRLWWEDRAIEDARRPAAWEIYAFKLRMASNVLWEESEKAQINSLQPIQPEHPLYILLREPSHLLLGYTVECLLKGLIVAKDPAFITEIMTHDVIKLAEMAELGLTDTDKALFEHLRALIVWKGKYPCPTRQKLHPDNVPPLTEDGAMDLGSSSECPGLLQDWERQRLSEIADELSERLNAITGASIESFVLPP